MFEFVFMPNGLAPAPLIFTRLMKPVFSKLGEKGYIMFPYIDDSFVVSESESICSQGVDKLCKSMTVLGFIVHTEKSVLKPTQRLKFLGFFIDSENANSNNA